MSDDTERPRWAASITDVDDLRQWVHLDAFLADAWGEDLAEELGAWLSGRAYRRRYPESRCAAKEVGVYPHNQTARFVWEHGWVFENLRLAQHWDQRDSSGATRRDTTMAQLREIVTRIGDVTIDATDAELRDVEHKLHLAAHALGVKIDDLPGSCSFKAAGIDKTDRESGET